MARTPLLEARGLVREHTDGGTRIAALAGVDVAVLPGEWLAVVGPSGSGKTTLLQILGGLDRPDAGTLELDGTPATTARLRAASAFVFQDFRLVPYLSARENVALGALFGGVRDAMAAATALERVGVGKLGGARPATLSGGERQRVAVARALVKRPRLLLADEPTGNLDRRNAEALAALFRELSERDGLAVVTVTHDGELAAAAHRRIALEHGRIVGGSIE